MYNYIGKTHINNHVQSFLPGRQSEVDGWAHFGFLPSPPRSASSLARHRRWQHAWGVQHRIHRIGRTPESGGWRRGTSPRAGWKLAPPPALPLLLGPSAGPWAARGLESPAPVSHHLAGRRIQAGGRCRLLGRCGTSASSSFSAELLRDVGAADLTSLGSSGPWPSAGSWPLPPSSSALLRAGRRLPSEYVTCGPSPLVARSKFLVYIFQTTTVVLLLYIIFFKPEK